MDDAILNAMDEARLKDMGGSLYEDDGDGIEPTDEDYTAILSGMSDERWTAPRPGWYRVMGVGAPVFVGEEPPAADRPEHLVHFEATAADPTPCRNCQGAYDPTDPAAVTRHTEPVDCGQSCRCRGRASCYTCFGSFCYCVAH